MRHGQLGLKYFFASALILAHQAAVASDAVATAPDLTTGQTAYALSGKSTHPVAASADDLVRTAAEADAMIMISVATDSDVKRARPIVAQALEAHVDLFLEGPAALIPELQPAQTRVWAAGDRMFVSNRSEPRGTVMQAFEASLTADQVWTAIVALRTALDRDKPAAAPILASARASIPVPTPVDTPASRIVKRSVPADVPAASSGTFEMPSFVAKTPSEVCIAIRNKLIDTVTASHETLSVADASKAVSRVCQYGTLGEFTATPPDVFLASDGNDAQNVLNLRQEWLLIISEDKADPKQSSAYLWLRTLGDNAGSGFSWANGHGGHAYNYYRTVDMHRIMSAEVFSGWGPANLSLYSWEHGNPADVFECESRPDAVDQNTDVNSVLTTVYCPVSPRLLSALPGDSFDDTVTVTAATSWTFGGSYTLNPSISTSGASVGALLGVNVSHTSTETSSATLHMVRTSTTANTRMYRLTEWSPNWEAMARWVRAKKLSYGTDTSLESASPLASVLNPAWSIVWQLPLAENAGRKTLYTSIFGVRNQWCSYNESANRCENTPTIQHGLWMKNTSIFVSLDDFK